MQGTSEPPNYHLGHAQGHVDFYVNMREQPGCCLRYPSNGITTYAHL